MRTTWSPSWPLSRAPNMPTLPKSSTSASSSCCAAQLAHDEHDLENLGRLRVLLPRPEVVHFEHPGTARADTEVENLMPRRARHRAVECERRLADLRDEPARNRLGLPSVPGPRSRRQRNLQ